MEGSHTQASRTPMSWVVFPGARVDVWYTRHGPPLPRTCPALFSPRGFSGLNPGKRKSTPRFPDLYTPTPLTCFQASAPTFQEPAGCPLLQLSLSTLHAFHLLPADYSPPTTTLTVSFICSQYVLQLPIPYKRRLHTSVQVHVVGARGRCTWQVQPCPILWPLPFHLLSTCGNYLLKDLPPLLPTEDMIFLCACLRALNKFLQGGFHITLFTFLTFNSKTRV